MNKNISVWRGNIAPPTNYHLWYNENDDQLYIQKGTDDWSIVIKSEETRKANEIIRQENEDKRVNQERVREDNINTALATFSNKQNEFDEAENTRVLNEKTRGENEQKREEDCAVAVKAANDAANKIEQIENKLNEILESINGNNI